MPKSSMTMTEGELSKWLVSEGDKVGEGDPIAIIQTDKVEMEVEAPSDGTIGILVEAPAEVSVGEVICVVLAEGEEKPAAAESPAEATIGKPSEGSTPVDGGTSKEVSSPEEQATMGKVRATPAARAMAKRLKVDIGGVVGSGPRGGVRPADVVAQAEDADAKRPALKAAKPDEEAGGRVLVRYRPEGVRGVMARHMEIAAGIPQFTLFADIPLSAADRARKEADQEIGLTDVIVKAVALALGQHPILNSHYVDGEIVTFSSVGIGLAVDTEQGLIVPVLPDVDSVTLEELARRRREVVAAARLRRLRPEEASGATFTITNLGGFHIRAFQAVVDPPQVGILSVGEARPEAGGPATVGVSADHRVVDGAQAAEFLGTLKEILEYPRAMFEPGG